MTVPGAVDEIAVRTHQVSGGGGVQLHVEETGNRSGQPVLFIHGLSQSGLAWHRQLHSELARDLRLVALDLRGHGESERPADAYGDSRSVGAGRRRRDQVPGPGAADPDRLVLRRRRHLRLSQPLRRGPGRRSSPGRRGLPPRRAGHAVPRAAVPRRHSRPLLHRRGGERDRPAGLRPAAHRRAADRPRIPTSSWAPPPPCRRASGRDCSTGPSTTTACSPSSARPS